MRFKVQQDSVSRDDENEQIEQLQAAILQNVARLRRVEVHKRLGRRGYARGGLEHFDVEPPGEDEKAEDVEKSCGELAAAAYEIALEDGQRTNNRHYQVILLGEQSEGGEVCLQLGKPFMLRVDIGPPDQHSDIVEQLRSQNADSHKAAQNAYIVLERIGNAMAGMLEKGAMNLEHAGALMRAAAEESRHSGDTAVKLEEIKLKRERQQLDAALEEQKTTKGFEMLEVIVGDLSPALSGFLGSVFGVDTGGGKKSGPLAERLRKFLDGLTADQIEKMKEALESDAWSVLEAAKNAESDDVFKAQIDKLSEVWKDRDKEYGEELKKKLGAILGMKLLTLFTILQDATGKGAK